MNEKLPNENQTLKTEEYNKGISFRIPNATYGNLCRAISKVSGVVFTKKRRFFWSASNVGAEFTLRSCAFEIETDAWDGALWILSKDKQKHEAEMEELREAVEQFKKFGFFR